ncbi:MAG: PorT family protein [Chitinophagaceae bacterium]|nr:PorT family protein [Chitinophagaceae bacterium]
MRKLTFALTFILLSEASFTQVRLGFRAGFNLAHISTNDDDLNEDKKMMPAYQFGPVFEIGLGNTLFLQPQVLFQLKGTKIQHNNHTDNVKISALDLPLNLVFRSPAGFFIGAGPNFGLNLKAVSKHEDDVDDLGIGDRPGEVKPFDLGGNLNLGFLFSENILISGNYLKGFSNLSNVSGLDWKNNLISMSLTIYLTKKKNKIKTDVNATMN